MTTVANTYRRYVSALGCCDCVKHCTTHNLPHPPDSTPNSLRPKFADYFAKRRILKP
jgi:hypothetical protein